MFSRPQRSVEDRDRISGTGKAALAAACIAVLVCEYFLLSYRHTASRARSGELLSGTSFSGVPAVADDSLLNYAFGYFGTVTYCFPWLIVYFAWVLFVRPPALRQIDFFRVGLKLLGFNILVIGLCSLFSALFVAGHTGAGGVLGDFLNIFLFGKLPRAAAPLIPVLLTLTGIVLFITKSPLWFCERIGFFFSGLLGLDKLKDKGGEDKAVAKAAAGESKEAGDAGPAVKAVPLHEHHHEKDGSRKQRHLVEPTFGPVTAADVYAADRQNASSAPSGAAAASAGAAAAMAARQDAAPVPRLQTDEAAGSGAPSGRGSAEYAQGNAAAVPQQEGRTQPRYESLRERSALSGASAGTAAAAAATAAAENKRRESGSGLRAAAAAMQQTLSSRGAAAFRRTGSFFVRDSQVRRESGARAQATGGEEPETGRYGAGRGSTAAMAAASSAPAVAREESPEERGRPSTIIRDNRHAASKDEENAREEQGQSTIITKSALPRVNKTPDIDPYYLYNKYKNSQEHSAVSAGTGEALVTAGAAAAASRADSGEDEGDEGGTSTIITKNEPQPVRASDDESAAAPSAGPQYVAGAPGAQRDTVGNPFRRSEVSTVITRGSTVTHMQFGEQISVDDSGSSGEFGGGAATVEENPVAGESGSVEEARAVQDGLEQQHAPVGQDAGGGSLDAARTGVDEALAPGSAEGVVPSPEENIISFTDYPPEQDKPIEVGSLPSAFVPSYGEETSADDGPAPLRRGQVHLSEKDSSFVSYNHALRGINGPAAAPVASAAPAAAGDAESADRTEAGDSTAAVAAPSAEKSGDAVAGVVSAAPSAPAASTVVAVEPAAVSASASGLQAGAVTAASAAESQTGTKAEPDESEPESGTETGAPGAVESPIGRGAAAAGKIPLKPYHSSVLTVPEQTYDDWRPSLELMARSNQSMEVDEEYIRSMTGRIDGFMKDYHIAAQVADYQPGPVITRYDLRLEPGTRSVAIRQKQVDLCRLLMVGKVRIIDVIPGTPYVGLEVPNAKRQLITLRDVAERPDFMDSKATLPLCLGVNTIGTPVIADLAKAPHLLIAGTTGSGKSAGINSMLLSLILKLSPAQLRLILIDPKQVEFGNYNDLPHLITPVISEMEQAAAALHWCIGEMERRYTLIKNMRVHNLAEYNRVLETAAAEGRELYDPLWGEDMGGSPAVLRPLPYVVVVVDEFADLMAMSASHGKKSDGKSPDSMIARLTAKARAAGIHLILATQTPRSDVVTGMIKANMPSKIAYTVQSGIDSKIILDEWGAENLLGNGDMLVKYMHLQNYAIFRAHGPYASNDDVKNVVGAWIEHSGAPEYLEGVSDIPGDEDDSAAGGMQEEPGGGRDRLFEEVAAYARDYYSSNNKIPSITNIQITFGIGYTRAKRLMMQLQREHAIDG